MAMDTVGQIYVSAEAIVGALSFVGNLLVLVAIFKNYQLQTVTNMFIASLAIADMLVGLVVAPLAAISFMGWPDNFLGCTFINSIVVAFTQVSIFNLLAVAIERFFAIKHPFSYQKNMTNERAMMVNAMVWCIGLLFGFLPVFGWNLEDEMTDEWMCNFVTVIDMDYVVYFHFFGCIIVPLIIICAIYFYIFLIVRKQMSQIAALEVAAPNQSQSTSSSKFKKEIKAAKSLAIVILLFGLCWIPIHVLNTMSLLCPLDCPYPFQLLLVTIVLSHGNSAINPFLYAYGNSHFKSAFKKMIGRYNPNEDIVSTFQPSRSAGQSKMYTNSSTLEIPNQLQQQPQENSIPTTTPNQNHCSLPPIVQPNVQAKTEGGGNSMEAVFNGKLTSNSVDSMSNTSDSAKRLKMDIYTVENSDRTPENIL